MTEIIKYQAYDGTIFEDKSDCINYEEYAWDMFNEIISKAKFRIGSSNDNISFNRGYSVVRTVVYFRRRRDNNN